MYSYRQEYKSKALRRKYIVEFYGLVFVTQSKGESKKCRSTIGQNYACQGMYSARIAKHIQTNSQ